ncbi:MAG: endonuclease/exonuclease/phosphatase family protein [Pseudomonadales bacterium]|nr:endonuclease/exonuclease/phosphatase family protein [Pseudomonadales bacterium]
MTATQDWPRRRLLPIGIATVLAAAIAAACSGPPQAVARSPNAAGQTIKIATWNLEWLIAPEAFRPLAQTCLPRDSTDRPHGRFIPCDVAKDFNRSREDFNALARYARQLDADVIAFQEVDGEAAARLVFRNYNFCLTGRSAVQNTGFAIRRGIPHRCNADVRDLSLHDVVRRGAWVTLFPDTPRELQLLSVHLKSGCARKPLSSMDRACSTLARQVMPLETWIDARASAGQAFAVLGDFNRDLQREPAPRAAPELAVTSLWAAIDDGEPAGADLINAADGERFVNCSPSQAFSGYIDYIVLGESLAQRRVAGSFERVTYSALDATRRKLSDHCPVAIRLTMAR